MISCGISSEFLNTALLNFLFVSLSLGKAYSPHVRSTFFFLSIFI
jgi:hypothetical protein